MKIVVVGAGYAGTNAANLLAKKTKAEITVVNPRGHFVERIRLHQRVSGTATAQAPLTSMLRGGSRPGSGPSRRSATACSSSTTAPRSSSTTSCWPSAAPSSPMPGTVPIGTWEGAEQARAALADLPPEAAVSVIGSGPTGIETASEVAAARPDLRVRLVGSRLAPTFGDAARRRVRAGLARLNVEIVEKGVTEAGDGRVRLGDGTDLRSDLTLWAIVAGAPDLAERSGFTVNEEGRMVVDEFLRSVDDPRVFAAGDCAAVPGARLSCQAVGTPVGHRGAQRRAGHRGARTRPARRALRRGLRQPRAGGRGRPAHPPRRHPAQGLHLRAHRRGAQGGRVAEREVGGQDGR